MNSKIFSFDFGLLKFFLRLFVSNFFYSIVVLGFERKNAEKLEKFAEIRTKSR